VFIAQSVIAAVLTIAAVRCVTVGEFCVIRIRKLFSIASAIITVVTNIRIVANFRKAFCNG